ncbi:5-hydroxytryptamine receptor 1D-like [Paramacrobiotus metropolitanus]|uniref:5-hydroxytryptamine receptor 1D-like n=1 Tax=Paramacrobiotus metropolitanus TaxID=2943436 RepID=UPI002445B297|nr:5-hydroxytryptamine receptor 1D-like [Paramacrobiotus metropolitanus]
MSNISNTSVTISVTWGFTPISELVLMPFSLLFNGLVLLAFLLNPQLHIPFNFYLANLVLTNFVYTLIEIPLDIVNGLYSVWWMGPAVCDLYQYLNYVFSGTIVNTHMLITVNRIWALTFPHSYTHMHTKRTALVGCAMVWVYVHAACLPGLILNTRVRLPLDSSGCQLNYEHLFAWNVFVEFVVFVLPQCLITVAYPHLLCQRRQQRLVRSAMDGPTLQEITTGPMTKNGGRQRDNKKAFGVLTVSTLSVTLTWTPGSVYYGMSCFMDVSYMPVYFLISSFLFLVQTVMDPILFMMVLGDLRVAVWQIVKKVHFWCLRMS